MQFLLRWSFSLNTKFILYIQHGNPKPAYVVQSIYYLLELICSEVVFGTAIWWKYVLWMEWDKENVKNIV